MKRVGSSEGVVAERVIRHVRGEREEGREAEEDEDSEGEGERPHDRGEGRSQ